MHAQEQTRLRLISPHQARTRALGRALGRVVSPGDVVALHGELGSGKTQLVKGLVEGVGAADAASVISPTFVLLQPYEGGSVSVFHVDAYRLSGVEEFYELGAWSLFSEGVTVIEWAERVARALPAERLEVELSHTSLESQRELVVRGVGQRGEGLLRTWVDLLRRRLPGALGVTS